MRKLVRTVAVPVTDTVRLDIQVGAEILGVGRGPNGIAIYILEAVEQGLPTQVRHLRIVMGGHDFETEAKERCIGAVAFGPSEVYHVWEMMRPDRGRRDSDLGLT